MKIYYIFSSARSIILLVMQVTDYLPLTCPCPAMGNGCSRSSRDDLKEMIEWHRSSCHHRTNINSEAWCKCVVPSCNEKGSSIISRKFDCGKHSHEDKYLGVSAMSLTHATTIMLASSKHYSDKVWMKRLAKSFLREIEKMEDTDCFEGIQ